MMEATELMQAIYNDGSDYGKPSRLYHWIGGEHIPFPATVEAVRTGGLQLKNGCRWTGVDNLLPGRPKGLFFWGPEMDAKKVKGHNCVSCDVADLDTGRLYAFPAELAGAAARSLCGEELIPEALEIFAAAYAVPFAQYSGEFAAEFIYASDVPANILRWENDNG